MARPTDKVNLLQQSEQNYHKLQSIINSLSASEQMGIFPFDDRDRNIRDVLVHLYEWHQLLITWLTNNLQGHSSAFLPDPYNWKTYPKMNVEFWHKHQTTSLEQAKIQLEQSHQAVMQLVSPLTDDQLFTKKYYAFTGTTHLASYIISSTSSHYDWAIKKINKYVKIIKIERNSLT